MDNHQANVRLMVVNIVFLMVNVDIQWATDSSHSIYSGPGGQLMGHR